MNHREPGEFGEGATVAKPMTAISEELSDELAAFLCSEFDPDFLPAHKAHWPEDANDDGKREGGYVSIQPKHVQAHAREQAKRILTLLQSLRSGNGGEVRVKALRWEAGDERSDLRAEVPWGYYRITYSEISRLGQWLWESGLYRGWVPVATEAEAKAAAQADYEQRIRSALDIKP